MRPFRISINVIGTLIKDGWYWWYRKYAPGGAILERIEERSARAKKGLWADLLPVPQWEWRKRKECAWARLIFWRWRAWNQPMSLSVPREWSAY
jgi:hypothetical protein